MVGITKIVGILYPTRWQYNNKTNGGDFTMMVFDPLWETMKNENVSVYALIHKYGISRGTIDNLKHNRNVTLATIEKMCRILNCRVENIVEYRDTD